MLRSRIVIPLFLSSLIVPALGDTTSSYCQLAGSTTPYCQAERARAFAAARNAEINTSIAAVRAARARLALANTPRRLAERARELGLARTHCTTPESSAPRCLAERAKEFAAARNAEIDASIAAVTAARRLALSKTHCKTPDSTTPRCLAERAREFAAARNAEIDASIAAVKAARARTFAATRNVEINASIAAVETERARAFAAARNAEIDAAIAAVTFRRERNAEINASIAAAKAARARSFAAARNAEINASIAAVHAERALAFAAARNAEINTSIAAVKFARERNAEINVAIAAAKAEHERAFAAARNAEINATLVAYKARRALRLAMARNRRGRGSARLETGAISIPETPPRRWQSTVRYALRDEPCREAGRPLSPLHFSKASATLEDSMKPMLNRLAVLAKACPAVRIEIHGHADASGPVQVNRNLAERRAQAALDYLVGMGVEPNRLAAISHGAREPRAPRTTAENRARNRRVEFAIKDPAMNAVAARIMWDLSELLDPTYVPAVARLSP